MSSLGENVAAWQQAVFAKDFVIGPGPDQRQCAEDEVVIDVAYVGIAPSEWKIQDMAYIELTYPHVIGTDAAGVVVRVGSKVTRFKAGDRIMGYCLGLVYGGAKHGAFQLFTTLRERVAAKLPNTMSLSRAVVLPMAISTSSVGLFDILRLRMPRLNPRPSGETVVIWGASSSTASVAIQLACAAGYEVVTTASRHNYGYAKDLGAARVFDYADVDVIGSILGYLAGKKLAGVFDCIGEERTTLACASILEHCGGGTIATVLWPPNALPASVRAEMVWAFLPGTADAYIAAPVWTDFVTPALEIGLLLPQPEAHILTGGLARLQEALNLQKQGVSASKIVVEIDGIGEL
ncbi:hypothetical protein LTR53_006087 [Teratosphaeriaceae sp. CCFEE 6253]|nr:hypothetical protein LTR53_006087 [Teratosphaeriaceae sp. CCFEE 6253]